MTHQTPAAERRERRRADRRDAMLDAAMTIVLASGHDALTIAKLAKLMDMAVGAMYRYFPSKSKLIGALQAREVLALATDLAAGADTCLAANSALSEGEAALVRVFAIARCYLRQRLLNSHRHHLIDATLSTPNVVMDDESAFEVAEVLDTLLKLVAVPLGVAAEHGVIRGGDAWARTYILWAAVHGFDHLRKRDRLQPTHLKAAALIETAMVDLLRGWGATEDTIGTVLAGLHRT